MSGDATADRRPILIAGNYCHDTIISHESRTDTLGGSAAYLINVLHALDVQTSVVAKVGSDFAYRSKVLHPPIVTDSPTTHFVADYRGTEDRLLRAVRVCEPIYPSCLGQAEIGQTHVGFMIPDGIYRYDIGLAVGVAGEILPDTLETIVGICGRVIVDLQALIRVIDPVNGEVEYRKLEDTAFDRILHRVSFIKAAQSEAKYMDLESVRKRTCVIVTNGDKGSSVYYMNKEYHVDAFPAREVDPTGAGDSFLGGFTAGLYRGLPVEKAVVLGNYFGAIAVGHVGIPRLTKLQIENSYKLLAGNEACACIKADAGQHCLVCNGQ